MSLKIAVFGLGFVGLTTALGFADKGFSVLGYDIDQDRVELIKSGKLPFFEPGLDTALLKNNNKTFSVAENGAEAAKNADIVFFCVGTPCGDNGKADLMFMFSAIDDVIETVKQNCVFVIKSTVPPGTAKEDILPYLEEKGFSGSLANNPEFLREGSCWDDFVNADRIVCGVNENDERAIEALSTLYKPFNSPKHFVSHNTAEFVKYLSNSMLATMISFSNEMSIIADAVGGIEIGKAFKVLHEDKRLAGSGIASYIYPGCGYGGYCLPKDTQALSAKAEEKGVVPHILKSTTMINEKMPEYIVNKIKATTNGTDTKIGILGLSFKPDSDDVRDSSAAKIIQLLFQDNYRNIFVHDPIANEIFANAYDFDVTYCSTKEDVLDISETVVVVTAWNEYKSIKIAQYDKEILDLRYCLG